MRRHGRWLTIAVTSGLVALISMSVRGGRAEDAKRLTAEDVIELWEPRLEGVEDFQRFWAAPKDSSAVATATFRVVGPSFEALWNHYAGLCGAKERYEAKNLVISSGTGAKGTYIINDRATSLAKADRALSVFLLRTDRYTVTATVQPDPDGKALRGSIAAVVP